MVSIKLDPAQWNGVVSNASSALNNVNTTSTVSVTKTSIDPFKSVPKVLSDINAVLSSYKAAAQTDLSKMEQAAQTIVDEDQNAGNQIKNSVRFQ